MFVALCFIKPEQLPGLFRSLGKGVRQVRRLRDEVMQGVGEVKKDLGLDGDLLPGDSASGQPPRRPDRPAVDIPRSGSPDGPQSGAESYDQGGGI